MLKQILCFAFVITQFICMPSLGESWNCQILPSEQRLETDPDSGARVVFATTNAASDTNFYFHERCFMWDNRLLLFNSDRFGRSEIMGYLLDTGELVRLKRPEDPAVGGRVASIKGDRLYVEKNGSFFEWALEIALKSSTSVLLTERKLADMPLGANRRSSLDENCDGSLLTYAYELNGEHYIGFCDTAAGTLLPSAKIGFKIDHLQFHKHRPDIVSFSRTYETGGDWAPSDPVDPTRARIWTMNVSTRAPIPSFFQVPGELATHECWWVNDQMTFIGGHHRDGDREEGNVKVLDFKTGEIRIIGAGAWVDGASAAEISKVNWWHASGGPDGKWVVADNWHGIVALFNAKTTEKKILSTKHRTYGSGSHLHAGWDLQGRHVELTSNRFGNPDVCIIDVPEGW
ncbi:MAG: hypothetical protein IT366_18220 [Candidatus Hydrogenedentes bacterium]|nr:hypothetical protein [Candidatus Hydrogenedentota bacterium]